MGFFDFLKPLDINQTLKEYQKTSNAILLDVRTPEEYQTGHIPKSKNIPLSSIETIRTTIQQKENPIFVYCQSGGRSRQAMELLKTMGYHNVKNLGGISGYRGKLEA